MSSDTPAPRSDSTNSNLSEEESHAGAEPAPGTVGPASRRTRGGCLKRLLIGLGVVLAVLVLAAVGVVLWKPWYQKPRVEAPSAGARRITDDGLIANYYPGPDKRGPAVLLYGGSDGGISDNVTTQAEALRKEGFTVLAISYWGAPGQPEYMENLPLETFDRGLAWLRRQPEVDPGRVGLMGTSKGGEATVLLASRHPDIRASVGFVPSSVVWAGVNLAEPWKISSIGSTWSAGGQPLPFVHYGRAGGKLVDTYRAGLAGIGPDDPAVIPVEKAKGPLLLVCGLDDTLWPSCPMSRQVAERAAKRGGPSVTVKEYPDAGHFSGGPPLPKEHPAYRRLGSYGGTPEGDNAARADGWPQVIDHLRRNLA